MMDETLDTASLDLAELRAKIEAARAGLAEAGRKNPETVRAAIARLDRIEAELKQVEATLTGVGMTV